MEKYIKLILVLVFVALINSCAAIAFFGQFTCPVNYADTRYELTGRDYTHYVVNLVGKSPMGIPIGPGVDGVKLDKIVTKVSQCLKIKFHPCGIHGVMIAPDWKTVEDDFGTSQVFPCKDPVTGLCRGVNQSPSTIFTTPNLYSAAWEIARLLLQGDPDLLDKEHCWETVIKD